MIRSGLVSITFRSLEPAKIVDLVVAAGLEGIEWGGDIHVPHGDRKRAMEVGRLTRDAGLMVAAYGSYYRTGVSEAAGLRFSEVLATAVALRAPAVRVWAGNRGSWEASPELRSAVVADSRRIADMAKAAGLTVSLEYHSGTLTDSSDSAVALLEKIGRDNVSTYWQPPVGLSTQDRLAGLSRLLGYLSNLHVFHWTESAGRICRCPLSEGADEWARYLDVIGQTGRERYAMIEFVRGETPESFLKDAETLKSWLQC